MTGLKPKTEPLRPTSCLLVDDNRGCIVMMTKILQMLGQTDIDVASDGRAAYDMMRAKPYGLVISDLHMDGWSGLDLIRRVRANERLNRTPMVLTTMDTDFENIRSARESGANAYILKPYTPQSLREKIEPLLRAGPASFHRTSRGEEKIAAPFAAPPPKAYTSFFGIARRY